MVRFLFSSRNNYGVVSRASTHPDLRDTPAEVIRPLSINPHAPSLRLHSLDGELVGQHTVSINYTYRITVTLIVVQGEIVLLNVGSHEEVYGGR